jgi:glycosyltransferase involved in cell wall biosynthesis
LTGMGDGRLRVCMLLHKSLTHDARVQREARELAEAGHDVTVLELDETGAGEPAGTPAPFTRASACPPAWMAGRLPFALYRLAFLATFARRAVQLRPDVVHAHDVMMLIPALAARRLTGARLVYDTHELTSGVAYRRGLRARLAVAIERVGIKRAVAVITVSDAIAERLRASYGLARTPQVVRNACALERPRTDGGLRRRLGLDNAPLVLYQGWVAPRRGCEALVAAMRGVPDAHLALLGDGDEGYVARLRELADRSGVTGRVHFARAVPLAQLLAHTREADVGVALFEAGCENYRLTLPNKLFEYLAAGVPVVAGEGTEVGRVVAAARVGWTADPEREESVAVALRAALQARGDASLRERVRAFDERFAWGREREGLLQVYAALPR